MIIRYHQTSPFAPIFLRTPALNRTKPRQFCCPTVGFISLFQRFQIYRVARGERGLYSENMEYLRNIERLIYRRFARRILRRVLRRALRFLRVRGGATYAGPGRPRREVAAAAAGGAEGVKLEFSAARKRFIRASRKDALRSSERFALGVPEAAISVLPATLFILISYVKIFSYKKRRYLQYGYWGSNPGPPAFAKRKWEASRCCVRSTGPPA
jgi:hypothetical protein